MFESKLTIQQQEYRFREALKAIPVKNTQARVIERDAATGEIHIKVVLVYKGSIMNFLRRILKANTEKTYILDAIGAQVYDMIDNKSTFEELIDKFCEKEKLTFFEARALLGQYFQTLTRRGIVVPMLPHE
jgi:hypothetical protein